MIQVKKLEKKNKHYVVHIDVNGDISKHEVSDMLILEYRLVSGKVLSNADYKALIEKINHDKYRQKLMYYCTYKPRTTQEARDYLKQFDIPEKAKANYINKLIDAHILDDDTYVKNYIEEYANYRMMGPRKIQNDLLMKGIDPQHLNQYMMSYTEEKMKENIKKWLDKKLKSSKNKPAKKLKEQIKSYIINKGFDYGLVQEVVNANISQIHQMNDEDEALQKDYDLYLHKYKRSNQSQSFKQYCIPKLMQKGYAYHKIMNLIEGEEANENE